MTPRRAAKATQPKPRTSAPAAPVSTVVSRAVVNFGEQERRARRAKNQSAAAYWARKVEEAQAAAGLRPAAAGLTRPARPTRRGPRTK